MVDWLPPELLSGGALSGIVAGAIWMIFTGRLVVRRTYDEAIKQVERMQLTNDRQAATITELIGQNRTLLDCQRESNALTAGLQQLLERAQSRGER